LPTFAAMRCMPNDAFGDATRSALYLEPPWSGSAIPLPEATRHHLHQVLRLSDGAAVTYTDGKGVTGVGMLASGTVQRGEETCVAATGAAVTIAVAPPRSNDRVRFLVEKLGELGVERLVWLRTRYGSTQPPRVVKARSWAVTAFEQSRGAWLMGIDDDLVDIDELDGDTLVADPGGVSISPAQNDVNLVIGPEGGLGVDEVMGTRVSLGSRILRVETSAIVGAALLRRKHHAEG